MTYHVMLAKQLRDFHPEPGSISVEEIVRHFMSNLDKIPEKSKILIKELNSEFSLKESLRNEERINEMVKMFQQRAGLNEDEAYERFVSLKKGHDQRVSSVISGLRAKIVETSTSSLYEEKHTPYGMISAKGGYWEFLSKEDYMKRMQNKDKISADKVITRMLVRDPNNELLKQIRNLTLLLR
jgi:hypothetical protein